MRHRFHPIVGYNLFQWVAGMVIVFNMKQLKLRAFVFMASGCLSLTMALMPAQQVLAEKVLRVGLVSLPNGLGDPYRENNIPSIYTTAAMLDGLTRFDRDGVLQPWLALSWSQIDPSTWRFKLRPQVTFQDGTPFNAAAVVAVVDYLTSDAAKREGVARELSTIAGAQAVNDLTVDIHTHTPDPLLPRSMPLLYAVQPDLWKTKGPDGFAQAPIGTGPFKLERWSSARADLVAYKNAWNPPKADRLILTPMPEVDTRLQALASGAVDIAVIVGPDDVATIEGQGGKVVTAVEPVTIGLSLITTKPGPLQDKRVRQALNYGVDRQQIVAKLFGGRTVAATGTATVGAIGYDPALQAIPYDPARAKALLAEAGYPNGFKMVAEIVVGGSPGDGAMYQQVAADLSKIGVDLELRIIPIQKLLTNVLSGAWAGDAFGMSFDETPSIDALRPIKVHSCLWPAPWYCDKTIMPKIEAAMHEPDLDKRVALTREIVDYYREEAPLLSLYQIVRYFGLSSKVRGFDEINGFIDYANIDLTR
jgi:peptide/nickel transport system substrate-binding protein